MRAPQQRPLSIFLFFLCVFSGCVYALDAHGHHLSEALVQLTVWCPGFAALCTCLLLRIPLGILGWGWPGRRFLGLASFLPLIYAAPVYLLTWLAFRGTFSLKSFEAAMVEPYGLGRWPALGTFGVALPLLFTVSVIGEQEADFVDPAFHYLTCFCRIESFEGDDRWKGNRLRDPLPLLFITD